MSQPNPGLPVGGREGAERAAVRSIPRTMLHRTLLQQQQCCPALPSLLPPPHFNYLAQLGGGGEEGRKEEKEGERRRPPPSSAAMAGGFVVVGVALRNEGVFPSQLNADQSGRSQCCFRAGQGVVIKNLPHLQS